MIYTPVGHKFIQYVVMITGKKLAFICIANLRLIYFQLTYYKICSLAHIRKYFRPATVTCALSLPNFLWSKSNAKEIYRGTPNFREISDFLPDKKSRAVGDRKKFSSHCYVLPQNI